MYGVSHQHSYGLGSSHFCIEFYVTNQYKNSGTIKWDEFDLEGFNQFNLFTEYFFFYMKLIQIFKLIQNTTMSHVLSYFNNCIVKNIIFRYLQNNKIK